MTLLHVVRFALRTLAKNPGFRTIAVTALALRIGANAAVFTLTNGSLFKSSPFDKSDCILYLNTKDASHPANQFSGVSYPDFRDWQEQARSFEGRASDTGERRFDGGGSPGLLDSRAAGDTSRPHGSTETRVGRRAPWT